MAALRRVGSLEFTNWIHMFIIQYKGLWLKKAKIEMLLRPIHFEGVPKRTIGKTFPLTPLVLHLSSSNHSIPYLLQCRLHISPPQSIQHLIQLTELLHIIWLDDQSTILHIIQIKPAHEKRNICHTTGWLQNTKDPLSDHPGTVL